MLSVAKHLHYLLASKQMQILRAAQDDRLDGWLCRSVPRKTEKATRSQNDRQGGFFRGLLGTDADHLTSLTV